MTISSQDRRTAEVQIGQFGAQDELTADLPNVLQNMLHEFSDRDGMPDDLTLSERRARKICDTCNTGNYSLDIASRLTAELSDYPFKACYEDSLMIDELKAITENDNCSLPTVQVSPSYFQYCQGYSVQTDSRGSGKDLYVLVMNVNHTEVLLYDPYRFRNKGRGNMEPTQIDKNDFEDAWLGKYEVTSTLWVEGTDQQRITQFST